jgi:Reverse transcriptase (RNA-dependent DNA polymerase)
MACCHEIRNSGTWKNKTWTLVPLTKGKKPLGCKWVFKIKYHSDGIIERHKVSLVAKYFTQIYGLDYQETFTSVAKMSTLWILLSVAVNMGWGLSQMNAKNAFLQGILEKNIYMTLLSGYKDNSNKDFVCKLNKLIYGPISPCLSSIIIRKRLKMLKTIWKISLILKAYIKKICSWLVKRNS